MPEKTEQWAIVELFGHQRIAGLISDHAIGGESFIRVDVPADNGGQPYTKLYGKGAIYAMTFVDQETGKAAAKHISPQPIAEFSARQMLNIQQGKPVDAEFDPDFDPNDVPY